MLMLKLLSKGCLPLSSFLLKDRGLAAHCRKLIDSIDGVELYSKSTNLYVTLTYETLSHKLSVVVYPCNLSTREASTCSFKSSQGHMVRPCL